jgi:hypothetical protein
MTISIRSLISISEIINEKSQPNPNNRHLAFRQQMAALAKRISETRIFDLLRDILVKLPN